MKITIADIVTLHQQGKRKYNEDYLFPVETDISKEDKLFIVCDGVGGNVKGDQASRLVCKHFSSYMLPLFNAVQTKGLLTKALRSTEQIMSNHILDHPETSGMATTLTYLALSKYGATIAWIGDSRVYHFRKKTIINQTEDHSLVNRLVKHGELTEAEARVHPKKNVILRAISGIEEPTKIDVLQIHDIEPGDYFLLCTDGVTEAISDPELSKLIGNSTSLSEAKNKIYDLCASNSKDNFTMILLQIGKVEINNPTLYPRDSSKPALKSRKPEKKQAIKNSSELFSCLFDSGDNCKFLH